MSEERREPDTPIVTGTGNIFADLDLPHGEEDMIKVQIAHAITMTIRKRGLTQVEAARILGVDQSKVSLVLRGRLKGFSIERLFAYLVALGRDVNIHISPRHRSAPGRIKVYA